MKWSLESKRGSILFLRVRVGMTILYNTHQKYTRNTHCRNGHYSQCNSLNSLWFYVFFAHNRLEIVQNSLATHFRAYRANPETNKAQPSFNMQSSNIFKSSYAQKTVLFYYGILSEKTTVNFQI